MVHTSWAGLHRAFVSFRHPTVNGAPKCVLHWSWGQCNGEYMGGSQLQLQPCLSLHWRLLLSIVGFSTHTPVCACGCLVSNSAFSISLCSHFHHVYSLSALCLHYFRHSQPPVPSACFAVCSSLAPSIRYYPLLFFHSLLYSQSCADAPAALSRRLLVIFCSLCFFSILYLPQPLRMLFLTAMVLPFTRPPFHPGFREAYENT